MGLFSRREPTCDELADASRADADRYQRQADARRRVARALGDTPAGRIAAALAKDASADARNLLRISRAERRGDPNAGA